MIVKERLQTLMKTLHYSNADLAKVTGISEASLRTYYSGRSDLPTDKLILIADALDCSCDYLLGRTDERNTEQYRADWLRSMSTIEKHVIEKKCSGVSMSEASLHKTHKVRKTAYEQEPIAVYPYNLISDLCCDLNPNADLYKDFVLPMSDDQVTGFNLALSHLNDRERDVIEKLYKDFYTLEDIAKEYHVTRERIHQIENKALRKLRSQPLTKLIVYGAKTSDLMEKEERLNRKQKELKEVEELLNKKEEEINKRMDGDSIHSLRDDFIAIDNKYRQDHLSRIYLSDLELSVRSLNCLHRAELYTAKDVVVFIKKWGNNYLTRIRNLGRKSLDEIKDTFKKKLDISLDEIARESEERETPFR